jgi:hypothetical protein
LTAHLYAAPGEGVLPMNALQILLEDGSRGSLESVPAGERILNYCFSPLEDDAWCSYGLDEADRVKLMAVQEVRAWSHVRYARALLRHYGTDLAGFATWFDSQDPLEQSWYRADEVLAGALATTGR